MVKTISPLLINEEIRKAIATKIAVKKIPRIKISKNKKRYLRSAEKRNKPGIPRPNNNPKEREMVIPKNFPKNNEVRVTDLVNKTSANGIDSKNDIPENVIENNGTTMSVKFMMLTNRRIPF